VASVRFREECRVDTIGGSCRPISRDQRERPASSSRVVAELSRVRASHVWIFNRRDNAPEYIETARVTRDPAGPRSINSRILDALANRDHLSSSSSGADQLLRSSEHQHLHRKKQNVSMETSRIDTSKNYPRASTRDTRNVNIFLIQW